jgi:nucleoside phosphorylase
MIAILFSTSEEAEGFAHRYGNGRFKDLDEGDRARDDDVLVAVTGSGKIRSTLGTERLLRDLQGEVELDALLHAGTCTSLTEDIEVGEIVGASFVLEGDRVELAAPSYPRMPLECPYDVVEATLVTQDHGVGDEEERSYWQRIAEVSDSSGYAVAYVAAQHGVSCHVVKVVSGLAGVDSDSFREDREHALDTLTTFLVETAQAGRLEEKG